jgi:hypothetical protein
LHHVPLTVWQLQHRLLLLLLLLPLAPLMLLLPLLLLLPLVLPRQLCDWLLCACLRSHIYATPVAYAR